MYSLFNGCCIKPCMDEWSITSQTSKNDCPYCPKPYCRKPKFSVSWYKVMKAQHPFFGQVTGHTSLPARGLHQPMTLLIYNLSQTPVKCPKTFCGTPVYTAAQWLKNIALSTVLSNRSSCTFCKYKSSNIESSSDVHNYMSQAVIWSFELDLKRVHPLHSTYGQAIAWIGRQNARTVILFSMCVCTGWGERKQSTNLILEWQFLQLGLSSSALALDGKVYPIYK